MRWSGPTTCLTDDERELLRLTSVFAGGFDLASICAVVDGADDVDVLRHLDSLVRKSLVVADHTATRTRYSLFETIRQFAEDRLAEAGALERTRDRHAAYFAAGARRSMGALERARVARRGRLGGGGARQPACRIPVERADEATLEVATDIAAHAALMGFSVQLFETLAWAEELLEPAAAADVRRLPRLYTAAGYACFAGRAEAARANAHRATELEVDSRYDACEPGYAIVRRGAGPGVLRRPRSLRRAHRRRWRERYGSDRGYGLAAYVDGLQSCGRIEEALALTEESVAAARSLGNPYWISYALWIAGMAFSKADVRRAFAAWDEGVAFVREHRVQFFEGFLARDAARLHTSDGEPEAALVLFAEAIAAFHRAGNVPQLIITLASVPALFERLDRLAPAAMLLGALSREPSSFHHVPELGDLGERVSRKLGTDARRGADVGGRGARPRRGGRLRTPADRRRPPRPEPAGAPGAARRPEPTRDRGAPPRRRRPNRGRDRDAAVHLVEDRRAPHPEHLHEDRRLQPRRGDPLGRQAQGRRRRRRLTARTGCAAPRNG